MYKAEVPDHPHLFRYPGASTVTGVVCIFLEIVIGISVGILTSTWSYVFCDTLYSLCIILQLLLTWLYLSIAVCVIRW